MMEYWQLLQNCLRPHLVSADRSHKQRNVLNAVPRRERTEVAAELVAIWQQREQTGGRGPIAGEHSLNMLNAIPKRCEA
jgi:hypothetical protein